MVYKNKLLKITLILSSAVFIIMCFSITDKNHVQAASDIPICPQVITTSNLDDPETLAVSTYTLSKTSSKSINRDTVNTEQFYMNLNATNEHQYTNEYTDISGNTNYVWSGIENVNTGGGKWNGGYTIIGSHIGSVKLETVKGWLHYDPNCTINGINIGINDFVISKWSGYVLFCGHADGQPVDFTVKIVSDPKGFNTGGAWWYVDSPISSSSTLTNSSNNAQKNEYSFNYANKNTPTFQNGKTNNIAAYYVEPSYELATSSSLSPSSPSSSSVEVGGEATYSLSAGYTNKRNIANNFSENISDKFELKHYDNGRETDYYKTIGSTVKTIPYDSELSYTSKATEWSASGQIRIPSFFTDDSGSNINISSDDYYCMEVIAQPASNAPYGVPESSSSSCVKVELPLAPTISCADNYIELGDPVKVPYTVSNNSGSINVDGKSGDFTISATINNNPANIAYPGTINGNDSGSGSIDINSSLTLGSYPVSIKLYGLSGTLDSTASCKLNVIFKPYFKVYGAGITSGSPFFSNGVCGTSNIGNIVAFNNGINGSSTDQAIFSSGYVYNTGSQNNSTNPPNLLTFTNTYTDIVNGQWGGNFDGIGCIPDYYHNFLTLGYTDEKSNLSTITSFTPEVQMTSSNDIIIKNNIINNSNLSSNLSGSLEYIVGYGNNIYIYPSVTEIDAVLIAEPDSNGNGGNIYTCQTNSATPPTNIFSCTKSLTIKGALIANTVHLQRVGMQTSSKSSNSSNGCESRFMGGEQVCFSPLEWLSLPSTNSSNSSNIDAIQQLPPTL